MKRSQGFTLIELLVVMAIIVIIASVGLTLYGTSVTRAKEAALSEDLFQMRKAIDEYYADKQKYPSSLDSPGLLSPCSYLPTKSSSSHP